MITAAERIRFMLTPPSQISAIPQGGIALCIKQVTCH
jgi:hypothetical protein